MATLVQCNNKTEQDIHQTLKTLTKLIQECRWIIDAYVSDFYTLEYWDRLPHTIKEYFNATQPTDLAWMLETRELDRNMHHSSIVPLSILSLQCCVQAFALKRIAIDLDSLETREEIGSALTQKSKSCVPEPSLTFACKRTQSFQASNYKNGQCMDMKHIFRKHVKPKKQHEIQKLGQTIRCLSYYAQCQNVVDVGAGLGHLSRLLSFQHNLRVTTIEAADGHAPKAAAFDREMKKDIYKASMKVHGHSQERSTSEIVPTEILNSTTTESVQPRTSSTTTEMENRLNGDTNLPNHVVCLLQPGVPTQEFLNIVSKTQAGSEGTTGQFVLAGLHACGDLTPTLLRVFADSPTSVGLASVACCYMKISSTAKSCDQPKESLPVLNNYPMSEYVKSLPNHNLSYEAREMACHFADAYRERLKSNSEHLKIHSYRAALQYLLVRVKPDFQSGQLRFVSKKGSQGPFRQYAEENMKKASVDFSQIPADLLTHCEGLTDQWQRVVAFYTLRLSLAPAVETVLLLDRMLFLLEQEYEGLQLCLFLSWCAPIQRIPSILVPIFDSSISPRNFALLALKS